MDPKIELKNKIHERFKDTTSPIFQKKVLTIIEESENDKESLLVAADKVSKLIALFIDKAMAAEVLEDLKSSIEKGG
jgi:DNA-binding XRE family transcriptional regulator